MFRDIVIDFHVDLTQNHYLEISFSVNGVDSKQVFHLSQLLFLVETVRIELTTRSLQGIIASPWYMCPQSWLRTRESNSGLRGMNPPCYHYTSPRQNIAGFSPAQLAKEIKRTVVLFKSCNVL